MLNKDTLIKVSNREDFTVGYKIPEMNIRRQFQPKESKEVTMDELRQLSYIPGGMPLLADYLIIRNEEAVAELLGEVEPEYYYGQEDIKRLLLEAPIEELLDCLDFAPKGVLQEIKDMAVKIQINDINKREAIKNNLGFDISSAIEINKETNKDIIPEKKKRRMSSSQETTNEPQGKKRRVTAPKYKVVDYDAK